MKKPLLITIPHSGEKIPEIAPWLKSLPEVCLMRDVDRFVDLLYGPAIKEIGLDLVKTEWHRYAVDLNRIPEDVDAGSVQGAKEKAGNHNRGFHWTVTTYGEQLMSAPMSRENHQKLVQLIYEPFHQSIENYYKFYRNNGYDEIFHIDAHSMPSVGTNMHRDPGQIRADIVVSDCHQKSAKKEFVELVISSYQKAGFKVDYNWPYFGGRVTEKYGDPDHGHHVVQVEMSRALYMNEETKLLNSNIWDVQDKIQKALQYIYNKLA